jgi:hypothetical protein
VLLCRLRVGFGALGLIAHGWHSIGYRVAAAVGWFAE